MGRITVKDVAEKCGCSVSTVSKALNGTERIGEKRAQEIRKTAAEMGYRANLSAQSLAHKTRVIGVLLFEEPYEVRSLFEQGVEEAMSLFAEFDICVKKYFLSNQTPLLLEDIWDQCSAWIVTQGVLTKEQRLFLQNRTDDKPVICLQEQPFPVFRRSADVQVDAFCVGQTAAQILSMMCRCKQVGVIIGKQSWIHAQNVEGFFDYAQSVGMKVLDVAESFDKLDEAYRQTEKMLRSFPHLDGLFVTSYVSPSVCRCILDNGRRMPIVGVDIFRDSASCLRDETLTALIFQNQKQQAFQAVSAVVDAFRGVPVPKTYTVKPEIILKSNMKLYGGF